MISTQDAISTAMGLLGTPYSELDCINFIKKIIRVAPGGDPKYTDANVPALWDSYNSSPKYKHLIARYENISNLKKGQIVFKGLPLGRDREPSHVGMYIGDGQVIHSSSAKGCVTITDVNNGQWTLSADHKLIEVEGDVKPEPTGDGYQAEVVTYQGGKTVNLRSGNGLNYPVIAKIPVGTIVTVQLELDGWDFVLTPSNGSGYMSSEFLKRIEPEPGPAPDPTPEPVDEWYTDQTFMSADGSFITLLGQWKPVND